MNRRRVLQFAGVAATAGLAGCLDGIQEHFGLQGVIPIEIHSEAERTHNLHLEARERETGRQSYEQSYSITPNETVGPPHLDRSEQSFRVSRIDDDEAVEVREVSVTESTELVMVRFTDDELVIEVDRGDDEENVTVDGEDGTPSEPVDPDGNETADTDSDPDE